MNDLRMQLKVCEGCGALWLRTNVLDGVYCRSCRSRLAQFPAARGRRTPMGPRRRRPLARPVVGPDVLVGGAR